MGTFETSLYDILNENKGEFNLDYKKKKSGGTLKIIEKNHDFRPSFMDFLKDGE